MNYQKTAGIALILVIILVIGTWTILFLIGNPAYLTWEETFNQMLSPENGLQTMFYASVASVIASSISAVIYFSKSSISKNTLLLMFSICAAQAIPVVFLLSWHFKIAYSLPVLLGYLAYKNPNMSFRSSAKKAQIRGRV